MTCRRAFDADLSAVVRGEGDRAFTAHWPSCPDCSAEVRVWQELDTMLRAGGPTDGAEGAHPAPERLVAFVETPATLAAGARAEIEGHLVRCRVCADEVSGLRGFDPARLATSTPPHVPDTTPMRGRLARVLWHPAFAIAVAVVLLVPLLRDQLARIPQATRMVDARRDVAAKDALSSAEVRAKAPAGQSKGSPADPLNAPAAQSDAPAARPAVPAPQPAVPGSAGDGRQQRPAPAFAGGARLEKDAAPAQGDALLAEESGRATETRRRAEPKSEAASNDEGGDREGAPSLHDLAGAVAPAPAAQPGPAVVELRTSAPAVVRSVVIERGVELRITPPEDFPPGPVDVHVRGRSGGHQLATRIVDRADAIAMRIPPRWLAPGDYVVTLTPADTPSGAATLGFTVAAPTAAEAGR